MEAISLKDAVAKALDAYESFLGLADLVFDAQFDPARATAFRQTASNVGVAMLAVARKAVADDAELAELLREVGESLVLLAAAPNVETLAFFPFVEPASVRAQALSLGVAEA